MHINKQMLARRFDGASTTYDDVASVQQQAAQFLVEQLRQHWPHYYPRQVLDLGAGSGYLTQLLLSHFPHSAFVLNDLSANMLSRAEKKLAGMPNMSYCCADFDTMRWSSVDLLISNLAMQWSADLKQVLRLGFNHSQRLAFSCLLQGTFSAWDSLFKACHLPSPVHTYWSRAECEQAILDLVPQDYVLTTQTVTLRFANAHAVMRYLQHLGASHSHQALSVAQLRQVITSHQAPINLTYELCFAFIVRSDECVYL